MDGQGLGGTAPLVRAPGSTRFRQHESLLHQPERVGRLLRASLVGIVDSSVRIVAEHVRAQAPHFAFLVRERVAGTPDVRAAIHRELELCELELATDLARLPQSQALSTPDLRVLSGLIVTLMVGAAEDLLAAQPSREAAVVEITASEVVYDVGDNRRRVAADTVVVAGEVRPGAPLADALRARGVEVHVVGDAGEVGYIEGAIHSAWRVARDT